MLRQSQHNVEMELCRDIEIYYHDKGWEELQKECCDQGFYVATYHSSINITRHERNVVTEDTYVATITRQIQLSSIATFSIYVTT